MEIETYGLLQAPRYYSPFQTMAIAKLPVPWMYQQGLITLTS